VAETPSGWLKPDDLSERGTARRALRLLGDYLDEDQQEQAERYGGFLLHDGGHYFWIPLEGSPWCAFGDDGRLEHYCIAPDKTSGMPEADVTLTYLLWIKFDSAGFLHEARLLSSKQITEWPDSERELVKVLAELTRPPEARRPRPRKVKDVMPRGSKKPELSLDADKVRAIFDRHGKAVPADILRKLTR
jgi:hypothetical protein